MAALTSISHRQLLLVGVGLTLSIAAGALQGEAGTIGRVAHSLTLWIVLSVLVATDSTTRHNVWITGSAAAGFVIAYYLGWLLGGAAIPNTIAIRAGYWALVAGLGGAALGQYVYAQPRTQKWFTRAFSGALIGAVWGDIVNSYRGRPVLPSTELVLNALTANTALSCLALIGTIRIIAWLHNTTGLGGASMALLPVGALAGWLAVGIPTTLFDLLR